MTLVVPCCQSRHLAARPWLLTLGPEKRKENSKND
jgi:hypothetical protein